MGTFLLILAILASIAGITGSVVPGIPGPPLSWTGVLLMFIRGRMGIGDGLSTTLLFVLLAVTVAVTALDFVIPSWLAKRTGGSKWASWGAIIGLFVGMFCFPPYGVIFGSFAGAFIGEILFTEKDASAALRSAFGAFLGFLAGTGMKIVCSGVMLFYVIKAI